ncbi:MAG TPA: cation transporter [Persephonella sp.]|uniref:Cation-transporting ATPase Pma1 n=1 Tax=Persephonella marina (strain DSM 14350 / EX-H1) TaxID=123214 RepID=C0QQ54_PERMH|nr:MULTISPECIES: cation-transporting P-type ATPase [Persephonella]ACO03786.1 cation-transporting ATPase Pma1 [Persephonella marina EX-H1]HCB69585.1 cation transporter [Persephonella sp.]
MDDHRFYSTPVKDLLDFFNTGLNGLSDEEVKRRIEKYGLNELEEKKESSLLIFFRQFNNPLVYILIVAITITFFMGDYIDAGIIAGIVFVNGLLGFFQEIKARSSIEALKKLTETKTRVLRDGKEKTVSVSHIVPGDIVILEEGDVVPADIRLIDSVGLMVDEAILTGESIPVEKDASILLKEETPIYNRKNMIFKGTIVVRGKAKGLVVATGRRTEIGKIAERIKEKSPETPLNRALKRFSMKWMIILFFILIFIFVLGLIQGRDLYKLFMLIISELVSAVPEGLPLVVTFVLVIGALALAKRKTLVKYLPSVETLGSATFIVSDKTGTITEGKLKVEEYTAEDEEFLFLTASLCNDATLEKGDPLEIALLRWLDEMGIDWIDMRERYTRLWEQPFDTKLRFMATVNEIDGKKYLLIKGAFESLIELAENRDEKLFKEHDRMAEKGLRVLAFGYTEVDRKPESLTDIKIKISGLVGFIDPPKEGVKEAVEIAKRAGIRVIMVTGDNLKTAKAVAEKVSIFGKGDIALLGSDIKKYSDDELYQILKRTSVIARATPEDKYRIVKVLQKNKEIVAVTGDGVNDVPALKVADLGIAMGSGTEAAKDVAKMIITDNNLAVIVDAVKQGRIIAHNIRKVIYYLLSCSFGEIMLLTSAFLLKLPLPLYPLQILWINVVTEGVQDKTFPFSREEKDVMSEKPKKPEKTFFDKKQLFDISFTAFFMGGVNLILFIYLLEVTTYERAVGITFTSLIANQWFNGFQAIREEPFFKNIIKSFTVNPYMYLGVGIGVALQLSATYLFPQWLHTVPLTLNDWLLILLTCTSLFLIIEIKKWVEYMMERKI